MVVQLQPFLSRHILLFWNVWEYGAVNQVRNDAVLPEISRGAFGEKRNVYVHAKYSSHAYEHAYHQTGYCEHDIYFQEGVLVVVQPNLHVVFSVINRLLNLTENSVHDVTDEPVIFLLSGTSCDRLREFYHYRCHMVFDSVNEHEVRLQQHLQLFHIVAPPICSRCTRCTADPTEFVCLVAVK